MGTTSGGPVDRQQQAVQAAHRHTQEAGRAILEEFVEFLGLPNVSADIADVERVARHIVTVLEQRGCTARTEQIPGSAPIVIAHRLVDPTAPTVGVYAHYDGQPVAGQAWGTPPFSPTIVDGSGEAVSLDAGIDDNWRIYARSSSDDKAPIQALAAALDAMAHDAVEPTVNLVCLFEGQEEAGSPDLATYLSDHAQELDADVWLICDGPFHQTGQPQVIFGVRGIAQMDITIYGPTRPLHSGHYGNWVPNPTWRLVHLLATMRDADGTITIDGFLDRVGEPNDAERDAISAMPAYERELLDELAVRSPEGGGVSLVERMYAPSFNLRGLDGGEAGERAANVLPTSATASIDIRLPPGHDPDSMLDLVEAHLESQGVHVVHESPAPDVLRSHDVVARVRRDPHYTGMRVPIDSPVARAVLGAAQAAAAGEEVVAVPTLGGSVPIVHFADVLDTPTIITPMANHDNNQHAANENLRIGNLWYGVRMMAAMLTIGAIED